MATTAALNPKINKVEGKISNITNLASNTALTKRKIIDYNIKINEIEKKITDHDHNILVLHNILLLQNLIS